MQPVSVRETFNGEALIGKGLSVGETVVVRGQYRLTPGTVVSLDNPNNSAAVANPTPASAGCCHEHLGRIHTKAHRHPHADGADPAARLHWLRAATGGGLPNIDTPTVLVTAQFPGADAQTVASTVTTPLERQFGQIPGLTQMTSSSGNESSEIYIAIRSQNQRQFCFAGGAGGHQCGG
jgi:hypothetical protein